MNPISGNGYVIVGYKTQLFDSTPSGAWSSSNTAIATVDTSGNVTGVASGSVVISYTVADTSATFNMNVVSVQITNGFDMARIFPALDGRIGFTQPTKAGSPALDSRTLSASSGRLWTEGHGMVTVNKIFNAQEDENITNDAFNQYLVDLDHRVTSRCLNGVFSTLPTYIEHHLCYLRRNYQQNVLIPVTSGGAFCGYRIQIAEGDFAVVFNAISLFFSGAATFNLYLFNDLILAPVKTLSVTTVANSQTKVQLDWAINYIQQNNNGGIWYIGYFDSDLPAGVQAIDEQLNLWENSIVWNGTPFTSAKTGALNFNRRYVGTTFYSYGLNVEMSSYRDYTQVIVQNPQLFDEMRILSYAITVLDIIKNSLRTGGEMRVLQPLITKADTDLAFPTQDFPFVAGLKQQLTRAIKNVADGFKPKIEMKSFPVVCNSSQGGDGIYDQYQGFDVNNLPTRQTLT